MKIPKYILNKINRRARAGDILNGLDCEIHDWMRKKRVEDDYSFLEHDGHFELIIQNCITLITEPVTVKQITIEYLEQAKEREKDDR